MGFTFNFPSCRRISWWSHLNFFLETKFKKSFLFWNRQSNIDQLPLEPILTKSSFIKLAKRIQKPLLSQKLLLTSQKLRQTGPKCKPKTKWISSNSKDLLQYRIQMIRVKGKSVTQQLHFSSTLQKKNGLKKILKQKINNNEKY